MPKVYFVSEDIEVEVNEGASLQDAADKAGSNFPFGCRMGSCGTCRCIVTEGSESLNTLTDQENELFESLTSVGAHERLGCQLVINGDVKVRA